MSELISAGTPVALVIGGVGEVDPDGIEVLAQVRVIDPTVPRVAAVRWGEWDTARPIFDAITAGKLDHWVTRPVQSPDEEFHQSITTFLDEWSSEQGGTFEAVQVIGERWSARSQELQDIFSRNAIPIGFYEADSDRGRQILGELRAPGTLLWASSSTSATWGPRASTAPRSIFNRRAAAWDSGRGNDLKAAQEARSVGSAVRFCVGNDDVATALGETLTLAKQGEGRADARCIAQVNPRPPSAHRTSPVVTRRRFVSGHGFVLIGLTCSQGRTPCRSR
jgi:hypothetical protein